MDDIVCAPHAHFDPYVNYISGYCGGLSLGKWHDLPGHLAELMEDKLPSIVSILTAGGPYSLYEYAS